MGCFGRLALFRSSRVVPDEVKPTERAAAAKQTAAAQLLGGDRRREAIADVDKALASILQAAGRPTAGHHTAQKPPDSITKLLDQLSAAAQQQTAASQVLPTIRKASDKLLALLQQQSRVQHTTLLTVPVELCSPAADALVSTAGAILFAHVVLDSAADLQRRHQTLLQLAHTLGFSSCSSLAACLQPATKATVAGIVLGSQAQGSETKVTCTVTRDSAFWDALPQLQQQGITQQGLQANKQQDGVVMLAKLFPRFVDDTLSTQQQQHTQLTQHAAAVEAGEGHGPRKEFFQLAAHNWTTTSGPNQPALLVYIKWSGTWWLNATLQCSAELQCAYWSAGWLMAQSITNRCTLGIPIAPLLFHLLMTPAEALQPTLELLEQHDPAAAASIRSVLKLPAHQFQQLLEVEQLPASMTRQQYVAQAVRQLLVTDVQWQLEAVRQGFTSATGVQVLQECCMSAADLAASVCGCTANDAADFNVQEAFCVVLEDEVDDAAASSSAVTCQSLWRVVGGWDVDQKRAFVKFVTGTDRLPAQPGSEQLVISFPFVACGLKDQQQLLGTLPQSHTCSNTLELPDYAEALIATQPDLKQEWAAAAAAPEQRITLQHLADTACPKLLQACCQVLEDRLKLAITCTSYGLDGS